MNAYLGSIIPKLRRLSRSIDDLALLVGQPWVSVEAPNRTVYIFQKEGELLITRSGQIETTRWDHISALNSVAIEAQGSRTLYNIGFFDQAVLVLRRDGTDDHLLLANERVLRDLTEAGILDYLYEAQASNNLESVTALPLASESAKSESDSPWPFIWAFLFLATLIGLAIYANP